MCAANIVKILKDPWHGALKKGSERGCGLKRRVFPTNIKEHFYLLSSLEIYSEFMAETLLHRNTSVTQSCGSGRGESYSKGWK